MNIEHQHLPDLSHFSEPYFFFTNNCQSELLYVSPSVEQVLGYPPEEVIGRRFTEFLDPTSPLNSDLPDCQKIKYIDGENHQQLRVVETRDDRLKVLNVQTYGRHDDQGRVISHHSIAQDVTDIYFVEQEMHKRLIELQKVDQQLSDRERFVLDRVNEGMLNKAIANRLDISQRSVEKIRSRLVEKFESKSMIEVVAKSTELKLLSEVVLLARGAHPGHQGPNKPTSRLLRKTDQVSKPTPKGGNPN